MTTLVIIIDLGESAKMIVEKILECDQCHLDDINKEYITWLDSALFQAWLRDRIVNDEYYIIHRKVETAQFSAYDCCELIELFELLDNNGGFKVISHDDHWIIECNKIKLDNLLYGESPDPRFLNYASYYDWAR